MALPPRIGEWARPYWCVDNDGGERMRLARNGGHPPTCIFPLMLSFYLHTGHHRFTVLDVVWSLWTGDP